VGEWERTPKTGETERRAPAQRPYASSRSIAGRVELALALYFLGVTIVAARAGLYRAVPFPILLGLGFGYVGWSSLWASLASQRASGARSGGPRSFGRAPTGG
jgi:hypothetical protein